MFIESGLVLTLVVGIVGLLLTMAGSWFHVIRNQNASAAKQDEKIDRLDKKIDDQGAALRSEMRDLRKEVRDDRKENAKRHAEMMNLLLRLAERTGYLKGRAEAKQDARRPDATVGAEGSTRVEGRAEAKPPDAQASDAVKAEGSARAEGREEAVAS